MTTEEIEELMVEAGIHRLKIDRKFGKYFVEANNKKTEETWHRRGFDLGELIHEVLNGNE